jgi:DNA polymerase-3 subunit gamma/tau
MIDEVHMLSNTAFNAMLKTLEEPPEYLKFVLATTDPQKVPVTVLSRCLQFNLRPMAPETVLEHLVRVLQAEGIEAEPGALRLLARAARGSMRDALSLTDQAIAYGAGRVDEAAVRHMLGAVDRAHVLRLVEALAASDGVTVVRTVDELRNAGLSAAGTLEELATLAQEMAVLQAVPEAADAADPHVQAVQRLAALMPADETQLLYSLALHGRGELGLAPDEYSALVMVLLRMLAFKPAGAPGARAEPQARGSVQGAPPRAAAEAPALRPAPAPAAVAAVVAAAPVALVATEAAPPVPAPPRAEPVARPATQEASAEPARLPSGEPPKEPPKELPKDPPATHANERWVAVVGALLERGSVTALVRELAWQAQCLAIDEAHTPPRWTLQVDRESLRQPALRERLEAALGECLGAPVALVIEAGAVTDSAARRDAAARAQAQARAEAIIRDDPAVVALMQQFKGARIVPGSVRPA